MMKMLILLYANKIFGVLWVVFYGNSFFSKSNLGFENWTFSQVYEMSVSQNLERVLKIHFYKFTKKTIWTIML
jgi:hypothetical protein